MKEKHPCSQLSWRDGDFPQIFVKCMCKVCREKGRVAWDNRKGDFFHVRVDDCINILEKRCDCIIFYSPLKIRKCVAFVIEVKGKSYHLREVSEKLQKSIEMLKSFLSDISKIAVYPIVYASRHTSLQKRALVSYRVTWLKPSLMRLLNWGDDVCKALEVPIP